MAVDKLVDSTQLNTDLTSVANAIRTKGGTSAQLAFPADFVSAVNAIQTGGGYTAADWFDLTKPTGDIVTDVNEISPYALYKRTGAITVTATIATYVGDSAFQLNTGITRFFGKQFRGCGANAFSGATNLEYAVLGNCFAAYTSAFANCTKLKAADFGGSPTTSQGFLRQNIFGGSRVFKTLVLRGDTVWPLSSINVFSSTPFASGGAGGTLYVPASLISSYQSATNWSTILGYSTNSIKSIESTATDPDAPLDLTTHYADGSLIQTS